MFDRLMESRRRRERRIAGTVTSVAAHAAIVLLAVIATSRADPAPTVGVVAENPIWVDPTRQPSGRESTAESGSVEESSSIDSPVESFPDPGEIDVDIPSPVAGPSVDIGAIVGRIGASDSRPASSSGSGTLDPGGVFTTGSVERTASLRAGGPTPRYPELLRSARIEGKVDLRFVVDTLGRVEPGSPVVLSSTNALFTASVRAVLPKLRFTPATANGRKVRMMVEMPFVFRLEGR